MSYVARVDQAAGRLQTETSISSAGEDRADVDNRVVTFLTALPEEVIDREVWSPGTTARDSASDALSAIGRWAGQRRHCGRHRRGSNHGRASRTLGLGVWGIRRRIRRRSNTE